MSENSDEKKNKQTIFTSYVGEFKADSMSTDDGVTSATFTTAGGRDVEVKGYKDHAKTLQDAVEAGGEQIIRGALLGGRESKHLGIHGTGPEQIAGVVSNVRHNFDSYEKDGKQPFVNMFALLEVGEHKIGRPVTAFGDDALSFKGVAEGDKMSAPARQTHESREVTDKESGAKSEKWVSTYRIEGPGTFEPAAEKKKDADSSPEPGM